ncbi:MAG: winged helix-turn-helix transcriptional regulator [Crenarchaeota archaeon]|nr:winged helix-turn-helix transcriptional regulator [Thermoproteota archaeon]
MDEADRKIISQLQMDGRTTLQQLSEIIGFTSMGTKKRLEKLIKQKMIKVSALINPQALGLIPAFVMLEMESTEASEKLIDRFKDCPRVVNIFKTIGGYNLIALVIAENQDTLESISTEQCSLRSAQGIRRSEFYPIGDLYFSPFLDIREHLTHKNQTIAPCKVNCGPCKRYKNQKCVGCSVTNNYKGSL